MYCPLMESGTGTRYDIHKGNNLTNNNGATQVAVTAPPNFPYAAQLASASSQYLTIANNSDVNLSGTQWSISLWHYWNTITQNTNACLFSKWNPIATGREYALYQEFNPGRLRLLVSSNGTNSTLADDPSTISAGVWYHSVCVYNGSNIIQYKNGSTVATTAFTAGVYNGTAQLKFGQIFDDLSAAFFNGKMAHIAMWHRAITQDEVYQLFLAGKAKTYLSVPDRPYLDHPTLYKGLVADFALQEASGNRVDNVSQLALVSTNSVGQATGLVYPYAAQFNSASSRYLSRADDGFFSTGDIDFTWAVWVYFDSSGSYACILDKGNTNNGSAMEYLLRKTDTDLINFFASGVLGSSAASVTSDAAVSISAWHLIVASHDAVNNQVSLQIDNGTPKTAATSAACQDTSRALYIGAQDDSSLLFFMNGRIGPLMFWKRILTSDERTAVYNSGNGRVF